MPIGKKSTRNTVKSPPPPSTRQAIIYARVSSKEQEEEGFSIPSQLKLLHDYARKMGLVVAQEFVEAETAKKTGRNQYSEMLRHLEKSVPTGKCRVLLVEKADRLYRNLKDYVLLVEPAPSPASVDVLATAVWDELPTFSWDDGFCPLLSQDMQDPLSPDI